MEPDRDADGQGSAETPATVRASARPKAGRSFRERPAARPEILLQPRPLILAGLPYRRDDSIRELTRTARTGRHSFLRVTFIATDRRFPLPFGADRSLLAWITTKAFASGSVRFSAIADYFRAFGLDRGGRSYRIFRERFQRIANLAIRIEEIHEDERRVRRLFLVPESVEPLDLLEGGAAGVGRRLFAYERYGFRLDESFWRYLRETRVPMPIRVLRELHDQPQAWDFAQLLLYRCHVARAPSVIPWRELVEQLGSQDRNPDRLRWVLRRLLARLTALEPRCRAKFLRGSGGLAIEPSGSRAGPGLDALPNLPSRPSREAGKRPAAGLGSLFPELAAQETLWNS